MKTGLSQWLALMLIGLICHTQTLAQTTTITGSTTPPLPETVSTTITTSVINHHQDVTMSSSSVKEHISSNLVSNLYQSTYNSLQTSSSFSSTTEQQLTKSSIHSTAAEISLKFVSTYSFNTDMNYTTIAISGSSLLSKLEMDAGLNSRTSEITTDSLKSTHATGSMNSKSVTENIISSSSTNSVIEVNTSKTIKSTLSVAFSSNEFRETSRLSPSYTSLFDDATRSSSMTTEYIDDLQSSFTTLTHSDIFSSLLGSTSLVETFSSSQYPSTTILETSRYINSIRNSSITNFNSIYNSSLKIEIAQSLPFLQSSLESSITLFTTKSDLFISTKTVTSGSSEPHHTFLSTSVINPLSTQTFISSIMPTLDMISNRSMSKIYTHSINQSSQKVMTIMTSPQLLSSETVSLQTSNIYQNSTRVFTDSRKETVTGTTHITTLDTSMINALFSESKSTDLSTYSKTSSSRPFTTDSIMISLDVFHTSLSTSLSFTSKSVKLKLISSNGFLASAGVDLSISEHSIITSESYYFSKELDSKITSVVSSHTPIENSYSVSSTPSFRDRTSIENGSVISHTTERSFYSVSSLFTGVLDPMPSGEGFIINSQTLYSSPTFSSFLVWTEIKDSISTHLSASYKESTSRSYSTTRTLSMDSRMQTYARRHSLTSSDIQTSSYLPSLMGDSLASSSTIQTTKSFQTTSIDELLLTPSTISSEPISETMSQYPFLQHSDLTITYLQSSYPVATNTAGTSTVLLSNENEVTTSRIQSFLYSADGKSSVVQYYYHSMQTDSASSFTASYLQSITSSTTWNLLYSEKSPSTITKSTLLQNSYSNQPYISMSFPISGQTTRTSIVSTNEDKNTSELHRSLSLTSSSSIYSNSTLVVGTASLLYTNSQELYESKTSVISISSKESLVPSFNSIMTIRSLTKTPLQSSTALFSIARSSSNVKPSQITIAYSQVSGVSINGMSDISTTMRNDNQPTRDIKNDTSVTTSVSSNVDITMSTKILSISPILDEIYSNSPPPTSTPPLDTHVLSFIFHSSITHSINNIDFSTSSLNEKMHSLSPSYGPSTSTTPRMSYLSTKNPVTFSTVKDVIVLSMYSNINSYSMTISPSKTLSTYLSKNSKASITATKNILSSTLLSVSPKLTSSKTNSISSNFDSIESSFLLSETSIKVKTVDSSIDATISNSTLNNISTFRTMTSSIISSRNDKLANDSSVLSFSLSSSILSERQTNSFESMINSTKSTVSVSMIRTDAPISVYDSYANTYLSSLSAISFNRVSTSSKSSISLVISNSTQIIESSFDTVYFIQSFTSVIDGSIKSPKTYITDIVTSSISSRFEESILVSTEFLAPSSSENSVSMFSMLNSFLSETSYLPSEMSVISAEITSIETKLSNIKQESVTSTMTSQVSSAIKESESDLQSSITILPSLSIRSSPESEIQTLSQTLQSGIQSPLSVTNQYISPSMSSSVIGSTDIYFYNSIIAPGIPSSTLRTSSDINPFSRHISTTVTNVDSTIKRSLPFMSNFITVQSSINSIQIPYSSSVLTSKALDTSVDLMTLSSDISHQGIKSSFSTTSYDTVQFISSSTPFSGYSKLIPSSLQDSSTSAYNKLLSSESYMTSYFDYLTTKSSFKDTPITSLSPVSEQSKSNEIYSSLSRSQFVESPIQNSTLISSVTPTSVISALSLTSTLPSKEHETTAYVLNSLSTSYSEFVTTSFTTTSFISPEPSRSIFSSRSVSPSVIDIRITSSVVNVSSTTSPTFIFSPASLTLETSKSISHLVLTTSTETASISFPTTSLYSTPKLSTIMPAVTITSDGSISSSVSSLQLYSVDSNFLTTESSHPSTIMSTSKFTQSISTSFEPYLTHYGSSIHLDTETSSISLPSLSSSTKLALTATSPQTSSTMMSKHTIVILPSLNVFSSSVNYTDSIFLSENVTNVIPSGILSNIVTMSATANITIFSSSSHVTSSMTPQTSPSPTTDAPPEVTTLNATNAEEPFWVRTVLKIRQSVDVTSDAFRVDLERKLAMVFHEAFERKLLIDQGKFEPLRKRRRRRKRYTKNGDAAVHIHEISRELDTSTVSAVYTVEESGKVLTAPEAVAALDVLDTQEVAILLQQVLDTKAEPYLHAEPATDSSKDSSQLWLVAAIGGPVLAFVIFIWILLCIYFKCCSRKQATERAEPKLTGIQESPQKVTDLSTIQEPSPHTSKKLSHQGSKASLLRPKVRAYEVTPPPEPEIVVEEYKTQSSPIKKKSRPPSASSKPNGALIRVQPPETPPRSATTSPRHKKGKKIRRNSIEPLAQEIRDIPVVNDDRNHLLQSSLSDDNEELQERARRERRKNKDRQRERRKKERDDQSRVAEYVTSQNHLNTLGLPHSPVPSVYIERESTVTEPKISRQDSGICNGQPTADENLEEARTRMHSLLDQAFSLISPRSSMTESDIRNKRNGNEMAEPNPRSTTSQDRDEARITSKWKIAKDTDRGKNVQHEPMYVNPAFTESYSDFPLETWSPYRASDQVALISMPHRLEPEPIRLGYKSDKRPASSKPNKRPAASFDFNESKSTSAIDDSKYTTNAPKPIVLRTKESSNSLKTDSAKTNGTKSNRKYSVTGIGGDVYLTGSTTSLSGSKAKNSADNIEMATYQNGSTKSHRAPKKDSKNSDELDVINTLQPPDTTDNLISSLRAELHGLKESFKPETKPGKRRKSNARPMTEIV